MWIVRGIWFGAAGAIFVSPFERGLSAAFLYKEVQ